MPTIRLTETKIKNHVFIKRGKKETQWFDTEVIGLGVRLRKNGAYGSYSVLYRNPLGKLKRFTIGRTDKISLAKARQIARDLVEVNQVCAAKTRAIRVVDDARWAVSTMALQCERWKTEIA